jgi:hypothetical protein
LKNHVLSFVFLGFAALDVAGAWHIAQPTGFEINPPIIVAAVFAIANVFAAWWIPRWVRRPAPAGVRPYNRRQLPQS